jgi:hypothetical protein
VLLSLVWPYYRNPLMLRRQMRIWRDEWPASLKTDIEIIVVDDGSPEPAADIIAGMWEGDRTGLPPLSLYRITVDRPWHQHAARNLGMHVATAKWALCSDMDHIVPASTLAEVLRLRPALTVNEVLTFGRVDAPAGVEWSSADWTGFARTKRPDGSLKPHVNSFCVSRKRYWKLGGYDEVLTGYGTDSQFRRKLFGAGSATHHLDHAPLIRVDRSVIPDASTTTYSRETQRCNVKAVLAQKAREGRKNTTTTLDFPWERIL